MSSAQKPAGPAFLQELAPDATLTMTVLQAPVQGADGVIRTIQALVGLYAGTEVSFRGGQGDHDFVVYAPRLKSGAVLEAVVTLVRHPDRSIRHVNIGYSPLAAAQVLATELEAALA
ncbi:hypothetical protein [Roseomonas sp. 18066]|uniref:hypothetical protein n=1 Tax=Roseomonas sp. 18066 TaxID=2681412 RepID=UPI00135C5B71|nr:hypothetical protein [Roseomonas sp. 18066]